MRDWHMRLFLRLIWIRQSLCAGWKMGWVDNLSNQATIFTIGKRGVHKTASWDLQKSWPVFQPCSLQRLFRQFPRQSPAVHAQTARRFRDVEASFGKCFMDQLPFLQFEG